MLIAMAVYVLAGAQPSGDEPPFCPPEVWQAMAAASGADVPFSPLAFGLWGAGEPEVEARDGPMLARGLALVRQVLRVDASPLAGRGRRFVSPDGFYAPIEPPQWAFGAAGGPHADPYGQHYGEAPVATAYAWAVRGELLLGGSTRAPVDGRFWVQGVTVGACFRLLDEAGAPPGLARDAAQALVAWPAGLDAVCGESTAQVAGGVAWRSRPPAGRAMLDWRAASAWPTRVASWSDGRWLHLAIVATCYVDVPRLDALVQTMDSAAWPGYLVRALPYRPQPWALLGLGPQTPDLMLGPVPDVIHPAPDLTPTVERCVATLPSEARAAPPPPLTAWKEARVGPAPALVERYLERPDLPESVCLRYDTSGGTRVTGLLQLGGVPGDLHDAHVWWTLGRDCLTVTVLPWNTGRPMWEGLEKRFDAEQDSAILTGLFGWRGRAISVVPSTMGPVGDTEWVSLVPEPNHEVGLLERVRVDQTEWGRCRVYKGYGIYHIVFDLLPEDVADR